jgi:site-specific recombinase XerD
MHEIVHRMMMELKLRNRSDATIDAYRRFALALGRFHDRPLDELGEAEVRAFLEYLLTEHKLHPRSLVGHISAYKFLYGTILGRPEVTASLAFPKKTKSLPRILSHAEILALIDCAETVRTRAFIMLGYGSGLRMSEVRNLQPRDIDSKRGVIVVRAGKGSKDRIAPLPERTLATLREYWLEERPKGPWLFPGAAPEKPMSKHTIGDRFNRTRFLAGLSAPVRFHSLRHSFATHMLEAGVDILAIQALLGHARLQTSMVYLRTRADHLLAVGNPLDRLATS